MRKHRLIGACWIAFNVLLAASVAAVLYSAVWEFSMRSYLKGFSDAIIPASDDAEQKVAAILQWMGHGPARGSGADPGGLAERNPADTLNLQRLLAVCGTATNAFVNVAQSSGIPTRRLLLLDPSGSSKHVVAETLIGDRWVIVDPSFRALFRLPDGRLVTRTEMKDPAIFRAATQSIPNYPAVYSYESTVHVRLRRIPWIGRYLRRIFNFIWPSWEEAINWTLLVERESFAMLVASILVLCFVLAVRLLLAWYCSAKLGMPRVRLRDKILRAGHALAKSSQ